MNGENKAIAFQRAQSHAFTAPYTPNTPPNTGIPAIAPENIYTINDTKPLVMPKYASIPSWIAQSSITYTPAMPKKHIEQSPSGIVFKNFPNIVTDLLNTSTPRLLDTEDIAGTLTNNSNEFNFQN